MYQVKTARGIWMVTVVVALAFFRSTLGAAAPLSSSPDTPPPVPDEQSAPAQIRTAIEALRKGDADTAERVARQFVTAQPKNSLGHEVLGTALALKRSFPEAERELNEALRLAPRRATIMLRLGLIALDQKNPKQAEDWFRKALSEAPGMAEARRGLVLSLLRQGQFQQAVAGAREGVEQSRGQDPEAKYLLATVYHEIGRPAETEPLLADVLTVKPDSGQALLLQGIVKLELGKIDEAAPLLQRVIARAPTSLWARLGLAVVKRGRGQLDESRTDLEAILKEQPDWALARLQLGQTLWLEGKNEAALRAFDQAEKASPNADVMRLRIAQFLLSRGDPDRAISRAQASLGTRAAPLARGFLAQVYLGKNQPDLAQRELEAAATEWPQEPLWPLQLGRLLLSRGQAREALGQFERAEKLAPGTPDPLAGEARAYVALKQAPDAVKAAQAAVRAQNESADAYVFLASIHEGLGLSADNVTAAISAYRQAITRDGNHPIALNNLAYLLGKDPARLDEAVVLAEQAYRVAPRSAAVADTLGWLLYQKGTLERAETLLAQASSAAPDNPEIRYHLGLAYAKRGKKEEARREIGRALEAPNFAGADEARRVLETLR